MIHSPIVYLSGDYLPLDQARISPLDRGFLFGDGVYEVMKCRRATPFYYAAHRARLRSSLAGLRIPFTLGAELETIIQRLLKDNELTTDDALIYLQITRGAYLKRTHEFPTDEIQPTVFVMASPAPSLAQEGIKLISRQDERWNKCHLKTINLLGNILARQDAIEAEAQEAVLVRQGIAVECSSSSLAIVQDGEVHTHPPADYMLPGVTMLALKEICKRKEIKFNERAFTLEEVHQADEVLVLSSVFDIRRALMLDERPVGRSDELHKRLSAAFEELLNQDTAEYATKSA